MAHKYGGPWSEVKLDAVEYYLTCYTKALTAAKMDLWYIDAFAGSGDREAEREIGGLLEGKPVETIVETLDGSARRALRVAPAFDHFVFIEQDEDRCDTLESVRRDFPGCDIRIRQSEANKELRAIFGQLPWTRGSKQRARAVVFLDPFSMQVEWSTLIELAKTHSVDVWYLFNVAAINRQLALEIAGVGNKAQMLDRVLSERWRELYDMKPEEAPLRVDMFDETAPASARRTVSKAQIDRWFHGLLAAEFAFVSDPLPIMTPHSGHTFSLFLAVANPEPKATELAEKFVKYVNRKYAPAPRRASRRRFGH